MLSKIITGVLVAFAVAGVGIYFATAESHCSSGCSVNSAAPVVQVDLMTAGGCPLAGGCCDSAAPACCEGEATVTPATDAEPKAATVGEAEAAK
jgi:hypothetical protein